MRAKFKRLIKLFILVLVPVAALAVLEFSLFFSGKYLLWHRHAGSKLPGAVCIACLGDSHTFGVGTSMQNSYPAQLEALLSLNNPGHDFSVFNLGIPGASTRRQAQELKSFFKEQDAGIVLLLTGRNNDEELKSWPDNPLYRSFECRPRLRSLKFFGWLFNSIGGRGPGRKGVYDRRHASYLSFYLDEIRKTCINNGAKLVLLSYYNSLDKAVMDFAFEYDIPYLDFTPDFRRLFRMDGGTRYVSPDMSHLNSRGYKFFTERLYEGLFARQSYLGFHMNPLLKEIDEAGLRGDEKKNELMVRLQEKRADNSRGLSEYPFELVHLGHIYTEIGREEDAGNCYMRALVESRYLDNNTIVSPAINWYLKKGKNREALALCEEILLCNPGNSIALRYRDWLLNQPH